MGEKVVNMRKAAYNVLKDIFGFSGFKETQEEVILNILAKKDTLAVMPTGSGKSLCYQIPALVFRGLTIVVSPLISLMQDQVEQMVSLGINAVLLNSSLSSQEYAENMLKVKDGTAKLLYVAPETLLKDSILHMLQKLEVDCFTIDEAHCISEWGHDFRPEYRKLSAVRALFPGAVCAAFTATATKRVQGDIKDSLSQNEHNFSTFITSFDRKNLYLEVTPKSNSYQQTLDFINKFPNQSGIIYCFSRKQVDELYLSLKEAGYSVKPYHAGLQERERKEHQRLFIRDDIQIMIATIAFGMGINKPNVRFVLHHDLPKNIEGYYQEIGRAGRDGLDAHCLLLFSYQDAHKINYFINQKPESEKRVAQTHLNAMIALAESDTCRRLPLLSYFEETPGRDNCGFCDVCTGEEREVVDITIPAQKFLSCAKKTGEFFGASHIIDVLLGSKAKKVLEKSHQLLSTYNIGTEYSKNQWQHLARQFIRQGLLIQDPGYGSLKLTPKAYLCLKSEIEIQGSIKEVSAGESKKKIQGGNLNYDPGFFEVLRKKRKEIADSQNVPPYVVFSDKTLMEIAAYFPENNEELLKIHGIGGVKCKEYGQMILNTVKNYKKTSGVPGFKKDFGSQEGPSSGKEPKYMQTGRAFAGGKSVEELCGQEGVKAATVLEHLYTYLFEGYPLPAGSFRSMLDQDDGTIKKVMRSFEEKGSDKLKPVYEDLKETISYDELKIFRLHYLTQG